MPSQHNIYVKTCVISHPDTNLITFTITAKRVYIFDTAQKHHERSNQMCSTFTNSSFMGKWLNVLRLVRPIIRNDTADDGCLGRIFAREL